LAATQAAGHALALGDHTDLVAAYGSLFAVPNRNRAGAQFDRRDLA